ncbi:Pyrroline-5-carboxylate reductase [Spironucleus salmonicida]|uniref:Pyrroline-5-carboxylate reductase n=1 Tax=Spironucleus salmonicida TaxID=348837 RepID=V6LP62_9EUKA|nr:Pyrroline-5-carboxylate reductase [Spironucleus salmonicida]|eukprot:EST46395.1 Pyrroline-5-carboxylate reductase [Spironucleus salmonicida]
MNQKIGVLGCGNMGGAIVRGLLNKIDQVYAYDRNLKNRESLNQMTNVTLYNSAEELARNIDVLIIAIKPNSIIDVLKQLEVCKTYNLVISVAANVTLSQLQSGTSSQVIRTIPNTAAILNKSITISTAESPILSLIGDVVVLPEEKFHAGMILGGCQPAFAMKYIRAAQLAGIEMGLTSQQAQDISVGAVSGAMEILNHGGTPDLECNRVMSPGGVTVKGVNKLEELGFTGVVIQALKACK